MRPLRHLLHWPLSLFTSQLPMKRSLLQSARGWVRCTVCRIKPLMLSHTVGAAAAEPGQPDQVDRVLKKLALQIHKPAKFVKAAGLLRQLLTGGQLSRARHRHSLFEVRALVA